MTTLAVTATVMSEIPAAGQEVLATFIGMADGEGCVAVGDDLVLDQVLLARAVAVAELPARGVLVEPCGVNAAVEFTSRSGARVVAVRAGSSELPWRVYSSRESDSAEGLCTWADIVFDAVGGVRVMTQGGI